MRRRTCNRQMIKIFIVSAIASIVWTLLFQVNVVPVKADGDQEADVIKIGILPNIYPLSECPPEAETFDGINVALLNMVSQKTGLKFEYVRIPLEEKTPYQALSDGDVMFVAGATKTENFLNDSNLLLSDRLFDGSLVLIGRSGSKISLDNSNLSIGVTNGYQAGAEYAKERFPGCSVTFYSDNEENIEAVRKQQTDMALVSQYVGSYLLQKPKYEKLSIIGSYTLNVDSCIMGRNTEASAIIMDLLNEGLAKISDQEYAGILMEYTIESPYQVTAWDILYKYRYSMMVSVIFAAILYLLFRELLFSRKEREGLSYDKLTGALTEAGFELEVKKTMNTEKQPVFIIDFDICRFEGYNEFWGRDKGNELLKVIVDQFKQNLSPKEHLARIYADHFVLSLTGKDIDFQSAAIQKITKQIKERIPVSITINYGIYEVSDRTLPISKMISCATAAKRMIKGNSENYIAVYDKDIYQKNLEDAEFLTSFDNALENGEFFPVYQPKYSAKTQEIVGAEALVRWQRSDGTFIMPGRFIELFERNGQIIKLDFYMLKMVCALQQRRIKNGSTAVPISVNFSRVHLFEHQFVTKILELVDGYHIPHHLVEIECTETTMTGDIKAAQIFFQKLRENGFRVSMDDFGSGYSSLNALKEIPLDIIKLDRGFLVENGGLEEAGRSELIIKNVICLAKDLALEVVAEGVENKDQFLFLKKSDCDIIQGYYFSKPVSEEEFLELL